MAKAKVKNPPLIKPSFEVGDIVWANNIIHLEAGDGFDSPIVKDQISRGTPLLIVGFSSYAGEVMVKRMYCRDPKRLSVTAGNEVLYVQRHRLSYVLDMGLGNMLPYILYRADIYGLVKQKKLGWFNNVD